MAKVYVATTRSLPAAPGLTDLLRVLLVWQDRWRQRQMLAEMDGRMLRDLGLSDCDVQSETAKPFWQR